MNIVNCHKEHTTKMSAKSIKGGHFQSKVLETPKLVVALNLVSIIESNAQNTYEQKTSAWSAIFLQYLEKLEVQFAYLFQILLGPTSQSFVLKPGQVPL